jgi:hypothetical protein
MQDLASRNIHKARHNRAVIRPRHDRRGNHWDDHRGGCGHRYPCDCNRHYRPHRSDSGSRIFLGFRLWDTW